ncbi:MAG: homoserine dehydrogenase [Candidatus Moduliflexus flocculans]|nr:homoserine dehydrogenase [Candidatus Moduliflexus flocculans]
MTKIPLVVTGFGHVGRAFLSLLAREKRRPPAPLRARTRDPGGGPGGGLLSLPVRPSTSVTSPAAATSGPPAIRPGGKGSGRRTSSAELGPGGCLVECTLSDLETGEPGLSYIKAAFRGGWHAVAASKGALVVGLPELKALAAENGVFLKFSGATAAALPTLDVGLFSLAGARIEGIQGVLNGTSNYILTRMGEGLAYGDALKDAQDRGIAEPDPTSDVGGWDTASKILLITNACLDAGYVLKDVHVRGIVDLTGEFVRSARAEGRAVKLLATAGPGRKGERWSLDVRPFDPRADPPALPCRRDREGHHVLHGLHGRRHRDRRPFQPRGAAAALLKDIINIYRHPGAIA